MQEGTMHRLWNRVDFAFSSAWQNFWRNAAVSIASVLIVWVVLLALGSLLLVLHSLDQIVALEKTKASAISVYLADTTPLSSAMDFKLHLESDPRVTSVSYVSKDQAMARFRQLPALDPSVIDTLGTNPLPASLDVTVKDIRDLGAIDQAVRTSPQVAGHELRAERYRQDHSAGSRRGHCRPRADHRADRAVGLHHHAHHPYRDLPAAKGDRGHEAGRGHRLVCALAVHRRVALPRHGRRGGGGADCWLAVRGGGRES